jgi:hypothetical protein
MADTHPVEPDKQQLLEWLPLAANQTLSPEQSAQLQAGLARHPELQHELRWLQTLRQTVQAQPLDAMPIGDLGWSRFEARMASSEAQKNDRRAAVQAPSRDWLEPRFVPVLAMACVLLVAQTVLIGTLVQQDDGSYTAAGGGEQTGQTAGVLLHVTVRPATTELQLREALRRFNARIVNGPSALGIYTLRVAPAPAGVATTAAQAAQRLTSEAGDVFDSASPAEGE